MVEVSEEVDSVEVDSVEVVSEEAQLQCILSELVYLLEDRGFFAAGISVSTIIPSLLGPRSLTVPAPFITFIAQ